MTCLKPLLKPSREPLENLTEDFLYGEEGVLERVDEFTLYCHYLGFEPQHGAMYTSPLREDDDKPSFGVYTSRFRKDVEYMWKDAGRGLHGDIFDLVKSLYGLDNRRQALLKIKQDFGLAPGSIVTSKVRLYVPKPKVNFKIRIKSRAFHSRDLDYWKQFNVDLPLLHAYNVTAIGMYWMLADQESPGFPRTPGYAYRIWDRYKLYFPFERREFKFRNDFDERHLEGFCQLQHNSNLLIITKALKDVMTLRSVGYEAVSARGESTMVPPEFMELFKQRYAHILVLMDNDGKHKGLEYTRQYGIPFVQVPPELGHKDISDFCKGEGAEATDQLLKTLYESHVDGAIIRSYLG